ncbi:MAG: cache domain-containing protein [Rhizobiaceae bacterium]|nr:cache domain-containing protein [Rhizobiaceae bacterium]
MNFRTKLLAVTILPIVLISIAALWLIDSQSQRLAVSQGKVVEEMILQSKREELENYVKLARAAVDPFYKWDYVSRLQAQKQVAEMITNMNFGEDEYFFVSRSNGKALDNPLLSELEVDETFQEYASELDLLTNGFLETDYRQGELYQYNWTKPSTGQRAEKIGMSVYLENWDWVIASGLYTDDIAAQIGQVQQQLEENLAQTRWVLLAMAAGAIALTSVLLAFVRFSEQKFADSRLKELAREIVDAQENERKRVSTELHDGISQLLVSASYSLDLANENAKRSPKVREPIQKSMKTISTAISEIRRISMALRPSVLDDMGLASAIKSLSSDFEAQTSISMNTAVEHIGTRLDEREKTTLYRVAQEALANIAKHSSAKNATIKLEKQENGVQLSISDDGVGFENSKNNSKQRGMGFRNIRERLESHGGTFELKTRKTGGTKLDIFIPTRKNRELDRAA